MADANSVSEVLKRHGKTFHLLGEMRQRYPEIEDAYASARKALAVKLGDQVLEDLDPAQLENLSDPKLASAAASLARERATHRRWLAERHGRADYGEQIAHTHDVTVRAVVALPALGTTATLGAGTTLAPQLPAGSSVDEVQAVDAEVVSDSDGDGSATV